MHLFTSKFVTRPEYVKELPGSVSTPRGFGASGIAAGLKKSGKLDLGLLVSKAPCKSAALYTPNAAAAAPVQVCRQETSKAAIQGIVVNSGSANACTGEDGLADARRMVELASRAMGIPKELVAVASTGVIGHKIPMNLIEKGIEAAAISMSEFGGSEFSEAIRTTDKIEKHGAVEVELSAGTVLIGACAKGAGMIAPNMATLLSFVTSDVDAPSGLLQELLKVAAARSFNSMSVDGDMSTNDCLFLMANGMSGVKLEPGSDDTKLFASALEAVCKGLALKMVADGEGATKVVSLNVKGAASDEEAVFVARAVSNSPLVRTAFYGRDANWGRLMASAGAALAGEPALDADIYYEEICLARSGAANPDPVDEQRLKSIMLQPEIRVTLDLNRGEHEHTMYFSDLTHDYVTLNAEYTT